MPNVDPQAFLPAYPLHFLSIIRYISLLIVIVLVILPREGGGTAFLIMLGLTALTIVSDVYGSPVIDNLFIIFFIRVLAVVIPSIMAGSGSDKTSRQLMGITAVLGLPSVAILLFLCWLDFPTIAAQCS